MELSTITAVWPIDAVTRLEPIGGGINNRTFRLQSGSGEHILRIYPISANPTKIAFEMAVLSALSRAALPFQTPIPLLSRAGEVSPTLSVDGGASRAIIVPVIPGSVRQPASLDQAFAVGSALGMLVKAMGPMSVAVPASGNYGDLETIDPSLPDPSEAVGLPVIPAEKQNRLAPILAEIMAERGHWYSTLPQQIIHGDCVPYNILMQDDTVTAVLDFELACRDIRTIDFAIGVWPWICFQGQSNWAMANAFSRGYTEHQKLTRAEVDALPFLLRLRRAASLIWWVGRYRQGTATEDSVQWAVNSALEMEDWLAANRGELAEHAVRWVTAVE